METLHRIKYVLMDGQRTYGGHMTQKHNSSRHQLLVKGAYKSDFKKMIFSDCYGGTNMSVCMKVSK